MPDFPRDLAALADRLRALHRSGEPILLPNAWDASSARAVVEAGFAAVATTSSGVSLSLGWEDGERTPPEEMFAAIGRIARATHELGVPLTADIEAGYGLPPAEVAEQLIAAGAVGCNYEDSDHSKPGVLRNSSEQARRISELKAAGRRSGVDLVVNARVDVFLRAGANPGECVADAIERGNRYLEAGADCVFPILVRGEAAIASLVRGIAGPVNILAVAGGPALSRLAELGVARVSFGEALHGAAMEDHRRRLASIRQGRSL